MLIAYLVWKFFLQISKMMDMYLTAKKTSHSTQGNSGIISILPVVFSLLFCCVTESYAFTEIEHFNLQSGTDRILFTGKIVNERGEALSGCTINEKGDKRTILSKSDGTFSIELSGPSAVVVVSYVGYETQELRAGNLNNLTITMVPGSASMEQVVVVGYAVQKKATVTGSISTVKGGDLVKAPVPNLSAAVVGRVPGLLSVQRSGQPGNDETTLRIRGIGTLDNSNAAPLVLVDGVERQFSRIDPNEIESISVLKDAASTAVYGIRGANGV
ncbi:MAG: hypothetical protein RLZZ42_810, partial [Bacteroidota bacterium]